MTKGLQPWGVCLAHHREIKVYWSLYLAPNFNWAQNSNPSTSFIHISIPICVFGSKDNELQNATLFQSSDLVWAEVLVRSTSCFEQRFRLLPIYSELGPLILVSNVTWHRIQHCGRHFHMLFFQQLFHILSIKSPFFLQPSCCFWMGVCGGAIQFQHREGKDSRVFCMYHKKRCKELTVLQSPFVTQRQKSFTPHF